MQEMWWLLTQEHKVILSHKLEVTEMDLEWNTKKKLHLHIPSPEWKTQQ
jgi:hypothetical protein